MKRNVMSICHDCETWLIPIALPIPCKIMTVERSVKELAIWPKREMTDCVTKALVSSWSADSESLFWWGVVNLPEPLMESNEKDTLPSLRNTIIGSIEDHGLNVLKIT